MNRKEVGGAAPNPVSTPRNRAARGWGLPLGLFCVGGGLAHAWGCGGGPAEDRDPGARSVSALLSGGELLPAAPRWAGAIGGEERLLDPTGPVIASRKFPATSQAIDAADEEARRAARGERTAERIVPVQGVSFEGGLVQTYSYVLRVTPTVEPKAVVPKPAAPTKPVSGPAPSPVISPALASALSSADGADLLPVIVTLDSDPVSSLAAPLSAAALTGTTPPPPSTRAERISARISEVAGLHQPLRGRLQAKGVGHTMLRSLWLNGRLAGRVSPAVIKVLADDPQVRSVSFDPPNPGAVANTWDGTNASNGGTDGLNANKYWSHGYRGEGWNPVDYRFLRLGFAGDGFYFNHSIFKDWAGGPSRYKKNWNCTTGTCVVITQPLPNAGTHETEVSSAAAGDATEGQVPGVTDPSDRLDHTGVAPEAELYGAEATMIAEVITSLQTMIQEGVDVFNVSRGDGTPGVCDYDADVVTWSTAVKNAHDAGVLVVTSADNVAGTGCSLSRWAEATSAFAVGGTLDPPDNGYATVGRNPAWSRGPMNALVYNTNGSWFWRDNVLSGLAAMVPGSWRYGAKTPESFQATGGTSLAAPQVAGAAVLVKNAFLNSGVTYMDSPGVLFATLLAMTDRSYGAGQRSSGFDPGWGGGRFQLRFFGDASDHPAGGAWGFDLWEVVIHNNEVIDFPVRGTGAEPATLQQFKVYAVVFEGSFWTVADVDLYVRDQNCAGADLGYDSSFDTKSMVRLGTSAASKALCVRLKGYAVPPGGRRVVLASYFSVDTSMR